MAAVGTPRSSVVDKILKIGDKKVKTLDPDELIEFFSTGSLLLDAVIGGIPRRRITEVFGEPNTGKTSFWMLVAKGLMQLGLKVLCIDVEGAFANEWATDMGVERGLRGADGELLLNVARPDNAEEALQVMINALKTPYYSLIVLDSLGMLKPAAEDEMTLDKASRVGETANMMTRVTKIAAPLLRENPLAPALIYINQTRSNIGDMYPTMAHTPGGKAVKFGDSIRLETMRPKDVANKAGTRLQRLTLRFKLRKNKVRPWSYNDLYYHLDWDDVDEAYVVNEPSEVYEVAKMKAIFTDKDGGAWTPQKAAWFNGVEIGRGENAIIDKITTDYDLFASIKEAIRSGVQHGQRDISPDSVQETYDDGDGLGAGA